MLPILFATWEDFITKNTLNFISNSNLVLSEILKRYQTDSKLHDICFKDTFSNI